MAKIYKPCPGDMFFPNRSQIGQWPPDGIRHIIPGTLSDWSEPWIVHHFDDGIPLLVISVVSHNSSWQMIVLCDNQLWWVPGILFLTKNVIF